MHAAPSQRHDAAFNSALSWKRRQAHLIIIRGRAAGDPGMCLVRSPSCRAARRRKHEAAAMTPRRAGAHNFNIFYITQLSPPELLESAFSTQTTTTK